MFGDYGIGIASGNGKMKLDISLLKFAMERKDGVIGSLKFNFN